MEMEVLKTRVNETTVLGDVYALNYKKVEKMIMFFFCLQYSLLRCKAGEEKTLQRDEITCFTPFYQFAYRLLVLEI